MSAISLMHTICKLCFSCFVWYLCLPEGIERIQRSAVKEIRQEKQAIPSKEAYPYIQQTGAELYEATS